MGLVFLALAAFLLGGLISFRRQGKPVGIQVVLGVAVAAFMVLALTSEPFA